MSGFRLVRLRGAHAQEEWPLEVGQDTLIGRRDDSGTVPHIDLTLDRRVSRRHARVWFENDAWWVEDLGSKHGTRVGRRRLRTGEPLRLGPGNEIQVGQTSLSLYPPHWRRLRYQDVILDVAISPLTSAALLRAGTRTIAHVSVHNAGTTPVGKRELVLSFAQLGRAVVSVPQLEPGAHVRLEPRSFDWDSGAMLRFTERTWEPLLVILDGHAVEGEQIGSCFLPYNEWSWLPEHRHSLAAFVLPNHPVVAMLVRESTAGLSPSTDPETLLQRVFDYLQSSWRIDYRYEPPHFASHSQKIRLPEHVLYDAESKRGHGTCLDLALLIAGVLESLHLQPLIAILDAGTTRHAIVGCWRRSGATLTPVIVERARLIEDVIWVDPNGCTSDAEHRMPFASARTAAVQALEKATMFAVDVAAARADGVAPLPCAAEAQWSPLVAEALVEARRTAAQAGAQLALVPLLIGLLRVDRGVTARAFTHTLGDTRDLIARLAEGLHAEAHSPTPSRHYHEALTLAKLRARMDGALLVDEATLLTALLDTRSEALDDALRCLGTDRAALKYSLRELQGGTSIADASLFALGRG